MMIRLIRAESDQIVSLRASNKAGGVIKGIGVHLRTRALEDSGIHCGPTGPRASITASATVPQKLVADENMHERPPITSFCDVDSDTINPAPAPSILGMNNTTFSVTTMQNLLCLCLAGGRAIKVPRPYGLHHMCPATASSSLTSSVTIVFLILHQCQFRATYLLQG
ncbi:hypothetical protein JHK86_018117 [Glycine max]|nr:hypothetical protein JHK86_018117 [Glycine max]